MSGICVGTKKVKVDCKTVFRTIYRNGELKAESYDEAGRKLAEKKLYTAGERTVLCLEPERKTITQEELCYVRLQLTDEKGTVKPLGKKQNFRSSGERGSYSEPEAPVLTARKSIRPVRQTLITGKHWQP